MEVHSLIENYSVNESLVEEIERLREENRRLRAKYWSSDLWAPSRVLKAAADRPTVLPQSSGLQEVLTNTQSPLNMRFSLFLFNVFTICEK